MKNGNFKILITLMVVSASLIFTTSCNKDDDNASPASIVGSWTVSESSADITINGESFIDYFMNELGLSQEMADQMMASIEEESTVTGTIEFKEDGTFVAQWGDDVPESGTWGINSDATLLTINVEGEDPAVFAINSLNSSSCVLVMDESFSEDMDQDGTAEVVATIITIALTR